MQRETLEARLEDGVDSMDIVLSGPAKTKLIDYLLLLDKWNRSFNLTAIRKIEEMVAKHILDSLSILPFLAGQRFVDVGTGAGLPGLVIAIARPDTEWVLIDSNQKKTRFLQQVVIELKLVNVTVVASRAEAFMDEQGFDMVTSRAVAELSDLYANTKHLSHVLLAMKGQIPEVELSDLDAALSREIHLVNVPGLDAERCVILVQ